MSLLRSSPLDSTGLRQANDLLRSELRKKTVLLLPAKRYNERALTLAEIALSHNIILRKRLADAEVLLTAREQRKNGKRISVAEKYIFANPDSNEATIPQDHRQQIYRPTKTKEDALPRQSFRSAIWIYAKCKASQIPVHTLNICQVYRYVRHH